jgi:hypothetical protein
VRSLVPFQSALGGSTRRRGTTLELSPPFLLAKFFLRYSFRNFRFGFYLRYDFLLHPRTRRKIFVKQHFPTIVRRFLGTRTGLGFLSRVDLIARTGDPLSGFARRRRRDFRRRPICKRRARFIADLANR